MITWLGGRLAATIPMIAVVLVTAFLLSSLSPNNAAEALAGGNATEEQIAEIRQRLNLDLSMQERFGAYVAQLARGDLGTSWVSGQPVSAMLGKAIPVTASLAFVTMLIALAVSVPLGILAALQKGRRADTIISSVAAVSASVPPFVMAFVLVIIFAINRPLLPAIGYQPLSAGFAAWLQHLILPASALALAVAANMIRQTRGALADVLEKDFIRAKIAAGLPWRRIVARNGMKNAAIPIITIVGLEISRVLGAAIVVEQVFDMPGIGSLGFRAVFNGDLPVVQGVVLVVGAAVLLVNFLVDISYGYFNPKLRYR